MTLKNVKLQPNYRQKFYSCPYYLSVLSRTLDALKSDNINGNGCLPTEWLVYSSNLPFQGAETKRFHLLRSHQMITQKRWLFRSSYRGKLQPNFEKKMRTLLEGKMNLGERSKASTTGHRRNKYLVINLVTIGKLFLKCILGLFCNYLNVIVVVLGIVLCRAMFYKSARSGDCATTPFLLRL